MESPRELFDVEQNLVHNLKQNCHFLSRSRLTGLSFSTCTTTGTNLRNKESLSSVFCCHKEVHRSLPVKVNGGTSSYLRRRSVTFDFSDSIRWEYAFFY